MDHIHEWCRRISMCKVDTTPQQQLDWFLWSLVLIIAKYIATPFPQIEDKSITKSQQFDLIYSQSGYLYYVLLDSPHHLPFGQDKPGASHVVNGLIGSMAHIHPRAQLVPMFGANQYLPPYGGYPYYPSPPLPPPFMTTSTPIMGTHVPTPLSHYVQIPPQGPPPTTSYNPNNSGGTSTSYNQYGPPQSNP